MNLREIGWDDEREAEFAALRHAGFFPARVTVSYGSSCIVWSDSGEFSAAVAGRLKLERSVEVNPGAPVVGDWVSIRPASGSGSPLVNSILPRRAAFVRKVAGLRNRPQVVAANVDTTFIVTSANRDFSPRRLERYLTLARESGAKPVVVLNKTDLAGSQLPQYEAEARAIAGQAPVHAVCAIHGDGMPSLDSYLAPGCTIAMLGSSGVGKSTLINYLIGEQRLTTQEIRDDDRGRHTTTTRELLRLPNGALVIDTPGMRELQMWDAGEGIEEAFADIEELAAGCRFSNCRHETEPNCAVRAAIETGTLSESRLESYRQLQQETQQAAAKEKKRKSKN